MNILNKIQNWTQSGPAGNDKQFLPLLAGLAVGGAALKGFGNWKASKPLETKPISPGQIQQYMAPVQGQINQMQSGANQLMQSSQGLMDPNSAMNQQYKQDMSQQSQSNLALQSLLNRRQGAALGQNSAITGAQNRMQMGQSGRDLMGQYSQGMQQRFTQGTSLMGQATGLLGQVSDRQMGVQENIAQAGIAEREFQAQQEMARNKRSGMLYQGLGGMLSAGVGAYTAGAGAGLQ